MCMAFTMLNSPKSEERETPLQPGSSQQYPGIPQQASELPRQQSCRRDLLLETRHGNPTLGADPRSRHSRRNAPAYALESADSRGTKGCRRPYIYMRRNTTHGEVQRGERQSCISCPIETPVKSEPSHGDLCGGDQTAAKVHRRPQLSQHQEQQSGKPRHSRQQRRQNDESLSGGITQDQHQGEQLAQETQLQNDKEKRDHLKSQLQRHPYLQQRLRNHEQRGGQKQLRQWRQKHRQQTGYEQQREHPRPLQVAHQGQRQDLQFQQQPQPSDERKPRRSYANLQQHLLRGRQQPMANRPVCCRPEVPSNIPAVVVELQKLERLYTSSFLLAYCHPQLLSLLQGSKFTGEGGGFCSGQTGQTHALELPVAAATRCEAAEEPGDNCATASKQNEFVGEDLGDGRVSCTGLCRFELVLTPTDPEFDKTALPSGLLLNISVGKDYPGAAAVLGIAPHDVPSSADKQGNLPKCGNVLRCEQQASTAACVSLQHGREGKNETPCGPSAIRADALAAEAQHTGVPVKAGSIRSPAVLQRAPVGGDAPHEEGPCGASSFVARLQVCNKEINNFRRRAIEMVFSKVIEKQMMAKEKTDLVRTALKAVDRHLREIFELELTALNGRPVEQSHRPWTPSEQEKLEEAVVLYRRVADPVLRWRNISNHVGSRSAKECAMRFQVCRENILNQRQTAAANEDNSTELEIHSESQKIASDSEPESNAVTDGATFESAGPSILARGNAVSLLEPVTNGVTCLHLSCIRLQVGCGRCKSAADVRISLPKDGATLEAAGCSVSCQKCQLRMGVRVQPTVGVGGSSIMRVATVEPAECLLKDLLPCDFILTCDCCGANVKAREVLSGPSRTNHCRHCHSKLTFGFQGAALGATAVCSSGRAQSRELHCSNTEHKQRKQDLRIVKGSPLANFGTCKHYKKSSRWLRFPCCGKAYPCDVCHDNSEDHEHEWATRMICGFCSLEQAFANGKPCACGKALTKDGGSAHWEGGKGCRDPTRMSRKDSRKYKLQSRQQKKA